jgi:hypothetical protein
VHSTLEVVLHPLLYIYIYICFQYSLPSAVYLSAPIFSTSQPSLCRLPIPISNPSPFLCHPNPAPMHPCTRTPMHPSACTLYLPAQRRARVPHRLQHPRALRLRDFRGLHFEKRELSRADRLPGAQAQTAQCAQSRSEV